MEQTTEPGVSKTAMAKLTGVSRTALYSFVKTGVGPARAGPDADQSSRHGQNVRTSRRVTPRRDAGA